MKCSNCINEGDKENMWCPDFNRYLCDDCWTEFRCSIEEIFGLDSLYDADLLLEHINFKNWIEEEKA